MVCKNNRVPNDHLRKDWYRRVKFFFDDPARKVRRQKARALKAKAMAPRPVEGPLRPIVHCPTARYNRRVRLGRGFTKDELIAAGIDASRARFLGIAVDKFRTHTKDELKQQNIDRLKAYKEKLVRVKPVKADDGTKKVEKVEIVAQPALFALPKADQETKWQVISAELKQAEVVKAKQAAIKEWKDKIKAKKEAKYANKK